MLGTIQSIEEVVGLQLTPTAPLQGKGGRLGLSQMLGVLGGHSDMDGYKVVTDLHTFHVLIDNAQSCCESFGYFASEDSFAPFIGAILLEVNLTDVALNTKAVEESGYYDDGGGTQFVDFVTDRGTYQLAVYNSHNGYYGHGILVAKDTELLLSDTI